MVLDDAVLQILTAEVRVPSDAHFIKHKTTFGLVFILEDVQLQRALILDPLNNGDIQQIALGANHGGFGSLAVLIECELGEMFCVLFWGHRELECAPLLLADCRPARRLAHTRASCHVRALVLVGS